MTISSQVNAFLMQSWRVLWPDNPCLSCPFREIQLHNLRALYYPFCIQRIKLSWVDFICWDVIAQWTVFSFMTSNICLYFLVKLQYHGLLNWIRFVFSDFHTGDFDRSYLFLYGCRRMQIFSLRRTTRHLALDVIRRK